MQSHSDYELWQNSLRVVIYKNCLQIFEYTNLITVNLNPIHNIYIFFWQSHQTF